MLFGAVACRASWVELSRCACIPRTVDAAVQTVEPEHRNRAISHVLNSCMRISLISRIAVRRRKPLAFE
jgi:hypothetical protein